MAKELFLEHRPDLFQDGKRTLECATMLVSTYKSVRLANSKLKQITLSEFDKPQVLKRLKYCALHERFPSVA